MPHLADIFYYPFKSLNGSRLAHTTLEKGKGLLDDRRYGLCKVKDMQAHLDTAWKPWLTCHTLKDGGALAKFEIKGEPGSTKMTIDYEGQGVDVDLATDKGRGELASFVKKAVGLEATVADSLHMPLWDYGLQAPVSFLNKASIDNISSKMDVELDVRRFRGNLLVEGLKPWEEQKLTPGSRIRVGKVTLETIRQISRCAATRINPDTARDDVNVPAHMVNSLGHNVCGIGMKVIEGGQISCGDAVSMSV